MKAPLALIGMTLATVLGASPAGADGYSVRVQVDAPVFVPGYVSPPTIIYRTVPPIYRPPPFIDYPASRVFINTNPGLVWVEGMWVFDGRQRWWRDGYWRGPENPYDQPRWHPRSGYRDDGGYRHHHLR
ncbi:hypothetical protein JHS3_07310 [Jeongeupia sp. HS-3]|uniref:hypothetical protein n=1 Tax=Jeongeupia sp. HS-3 TaxID=1009682 RepID=UPI0018A45CA3|nr:hypothetical protein [Jeongeupia sp. HS-3]BCL74995.1 hypothetical protein JHS3_07310 [Jeongeupia sp. HS-3]